MWGRGLPGWRRLALDLLGWRPLDGQVGGA